MEFENLQLQQWNFYAVIHIFIVSLLFTPIPTGNSGCERQRDWRGDACFSDGCIEAFELVQNLYTANT